MAGLFPAQLLAGAQQYTQFLDLLLRNEARPDQSRQKIADPCDPRAATGVRTASMNSNGRPPGALAQLDTSGGDRGASSQTQTWAYLHQGKADLSAGGDPAYTTVSCSVGRPRRWPTQTDE